MDYGDRIRAAREARGLTQFDLGVMIGRRDGDISRWERGALAPKIGTLVNISKALGVPLDYLAGVTDTLSLDPAWVDQRRESPATHLETLPTAPPDAPRQPPASRRARSNRRSPST